MPLSPQEKRAVQESVAIILFSALLVAFYILITGCASAPSSGPSVSPKYELTLSGMLDGKPFQGVALGSDATSHQITIKSSVDINMFTAATCHRFNKFEDIIKVGWLTPNRTYQWNYVESPSIEDSGDCILRLCAYSNQVGANPVACAAVDFHAAKYSMPSENICNGADVQNTGTMICSTKVGLLQRVRFASSVVVDVPNVDEKNPIAPVPNQCPGKFIDSSQTVWEYIVPGAECVVLFMEKAKPHRFAKLTVIPYDLPQYSGGK